MKPAGTGTPSRLTDEGATNHPLRVGSRVLATTSGIVADDETASLSPMRGSGDGPSPMRGSKDGHTDTQVQ